jgi:hypothetical protein
MSKKQDGFIIQVVCKVAISEDGSIVTAEDDLAWVCKEEGGWVDASSCPADDDGFIPEDIKVFKTYKSAERFAKKWEGHPWYCIPKSFKIFKVKSVIKQVFSHYEFTEKGE